MLRRFRRLLGNEPKDARATTDGLRTGELAISAYALDCIIRGRVQLDAERLSDMLNDAETIVFRDAVVEALSDGRTVNVPVQEVGRDELLAVTVAGPRGNDGRRRATREIPVAISLGPYRAWGFVHSPPAGGPLAPLQGNRRMVPVTGVALLYLQDGVPKIDRLPGLIVNRDAVDALNQTLEEADSDAISLDVEFGITRRVTPTPEAAEASSAD
jgi:hypothetical protein